MRTGNLFVVTGASGFVGLQLVPGLEECGNLLLVSRDPAKVAKQFPNTSICGYGDLSSWNLDSATFIHLAVRNNDRPGTFEEFHKANVEFLLEIAALAKDGGARRFVNLCSTHALDPSVNDYYGRSKQEGAMCLTSVWPEGAINLYVPAVYGTSFGGRLRSINYLPAAVKAITLALLRLAKPSLSIESLRDTLKEISYLPDGRQNEAYLNERYLSDPVAEFGLYAGIKRTIDLTTALAVIVFGGWLMVLIALYIRFDSEGPPIFAQKRVGKDSRIFTCFKFRTMKTGTADAATHNIPVDSVTRAGRFLRRTKLDELPQVVNVLRNEMSLVGPRPCLPTQKNLIKCRAVRNVFTIKPGITGLAQIKDVDMSNPARLAELDDRYRAFRTVIGDGLILLQTVLGRGSGDRVRVKEHE